MKRPVWATVIGILTIIFGIFGILGGAQEIAMPSMLEMQKEMIQGMSETGEEAGSDIESEGSAPDLSKMVESIEEQFQIPDWYSDLAMLFGIVSMLVAAAYLIAGVFLLMVKPFAIKAMFVALGVSIVWAVVQSFIYMQTASMMLMAQIPTSIASIVIDIVFIIVVVVGSKEAFSAEPQQI